jgi:hypothetical protein
VGEHVRSQHPDLVGDDYIGAGPNPDSPEGTAANASVIDQIAKGRRQGRAIRNIDYMREQPRYNNPEVEEGSEEATRQEYSADIASLAQARRTGGRREEE